MNSNASLIPLGEIVSIKGGKRLPKGAALQSIKNSHPYIRVRDMGQRYIPTDGLEYVPDEVFPKIQRYIVHENDVIISIVGTIGLVSVIDSKFNLASQTENAAKLTGLDSIDAHYLYYYLNSHIGQSEIRQRTVGAVQPKLPLYNIETIPIIWPGRSSRTEVVKQLMALDGKIQYNHQINQTLEQMAQAIFKSWFVDFDPVKAKITALEAGGSEDDALLAAMQAIAGSALFATDAADADAPTQLARLQTEHPEQYATLRATAELFPSAMQESELGEIPEGWSVAALADFGDVVCGKTPSKQKAEYYGSEVPFIKIPDMHGNVFVTKANEYLSSEGAASQPKKSIPKGSVCVSCIATVGLVVIAIEDSHTNQQINSIVPKKHVYTPYLYFRMQSLNKHLHDLASGGSATLNLNTSTFSKIQIIKPAEAVLEKYHEVTAQLLNKILEGSLESQTLSELRDTLLPKLLSGELKVNNGSHIA